MWGDDDGIGGADVDGSYLKILQVMNFKWKCSSTFAYAC